MRPNPACSAFKWSRPTRSSPFKSPSSEEGDRRIFEPRKMRLSPFAFSFTSGRGSVAEERGVGEFHFRTLVGLFQPLAVVLLFQDGEDLVANLREGAVAQVGR